MKRLEDLKAKTQTELDEFIKNSNGFDLPASFKNYEEFVALARRILNDPKSEASKLKIIQKMVHKVEVRKDGSFRLHYYVGRDQIAVNHWALENQNNAVTGTESTKGKALSAPSPSKLQNSHLLSSQTLTNGAHGQNRTGTPREEPRILSPVRLPIPPHEH